jgi:flagellar protein FlaJ
VAVGGIPGGRPLTDDERRRFREKYGYLRTYFKERADRHDGLQRSLNQARAGTTVDQYLASSVRWAVLAALAGVLVGVGATLLLERAGAFGAVRAPPALSGELTQAIAANRLLVGGAAVTLVSAVALGGGTYLGRYYYPSVVVSGRRQRIDVTLPHAIVYMYALSYGGMDLTAVIRSLADADDTYGEVAREFDTVIRDVDLFGNDLITALANTRNLTPSENFEQFLDDVISVLDSGGDVTAFLDNEANRYLDEASDQQEDFLETLSIMSEVFVVAFVAAPLFLIVILVVISLLGGETLTRITLLTYVVMPLGMAAFLVLIDALSGPYVQSRATIEAPEEEAEADPALADDERFVVYQERQRREQLLAFVRNPLERIRRQPDWSLAITVPLASFIIVGLVATGAVGVSLAAVVERPVFTATALVVAPFLVVAAPLAYYHERQRARENDLAERMPDTLNILSSANKMGVSLVDALGLVSRATAGTISEEMRRVRNDVLWNDDLSGALTKLGYRLQVPQLVRTTRLLADGIRSSGDLSRVLSIAASDARTRFRLERKRRREMSSYIAIVVIGFLVYLLVVLMLDVAYLDPIAAVSAEQSANDGPSGPVGFSSVPIDLYKAVLFHSALIQGIGSGLLAGKLADNSVRSGLKYSLLLVVLSVLAFALV